MLNRQLALFKNSAFFWYVMSCMLVTFSAGFLSINAAWIALSAYGTTLSVALIAFSLWLPAIALGPLMGVIVDRYPRKYILRGAIFFRAFSVLAFGILFLFHFESWEVYLLMFCDGVGLSAVMACVFAFVREFIQPDDLLYANATVDMSYEMGNVLGMGAAGLMVAFLGVTPSLFLNAALFFLSGVCLLMMKVKTMHNAQHKSLGSVFRDYYDSLTYLLRNRKLCLIYTVQLLLMAQFMTCSVLLAPFVKNILHGNVVQFGRIDATLSVGVIIGGVLTPWLAQSFGMTRVMLLHMVGLLVGFSLFAFAYSVWMAQLIYLFVGVFLSVWSIVLTQAQAKTDLAMQGRVQSTFNSLAGLVVLSVYWILGATGEYIAINYMYFIEAAFAVIGIVLLAFVMQR